MPTLAVAMSPTHWYSWVSEKLTSEQDFARTEVTLEGLIPLETTPTSQPVIWKEKLVVGHNVCYDRARVKEQYLIKVIVCPDDHH